MSGNDERFVRVKVTKETRRLIRLLAAHLDVTMMEAVETAVAEKLEEFERQGKQELED